MKDQRRMTFEQCMRLVDALEAPTDLAPEARAAMLEWGEKVILDWWLLNQMLAGSIRAVAAKDGDTNYIPAKNEPVHLNDWPPVHGKEMTPEDLTESKSGLFTAKWSGEHKIISSGEIPTSWLEDHPEAAPRKKISIG